MRTMAVCVVRDIHRGSTVCPEVLRFLENSFCVRPFRSPHSASRRIAFREFLPNGSTSFTSADSSLLIFLGPPPCFFSDPILWG